MGTEGLRANMMLCDVLEDGDEGIDGAQWYAQGDAAGEPDFDPRGLGVGGLDAQEGGGFGGLLELAFPVIEGWDRATDGLAELGDGELGIVEVGEVLLPKEGFVGIGLSRHGVWPVSE
jgi:hypothetical protein